VAGPVRPGLFAGAAARAATLDAGSHGSLGVSATLGGPETGLTCSASTSGSGCGMSFNSPPGASVDIGWNFSEPIQPTVPISVTVGTVHAGATLDNNGIKINLGYSAPTKIPISITVGVPPVASVPAPRTIVQSPDATAVRRPLH
jgi:hypothetical protein